MTVRQDVRIAIVERDHRHAPPSWFESDWIGSPYADQEWLAWWRDAFDQTERPDTFSLILYRASEPVAVLPLQITAMAGATMCLWQGGAFQNSNSGRYSSDWLERQTASSINDVLRILPGCLNRTIDLFCFIKQPPMINSRPNPFAEVGRRCVCSDALFATRMSDDFQRWVTNRRSGSSMKKLRQKIRQLSKVAGPVHLAEGSSSAERRRYLSAFKSQRQEMRRLGRVPNPFDDPARERFIDGVTLGQNSPGVRIFALEAGGRICAVQLCLVRHDYCSMFASSVDYALAKYSPGRLMEYLLLQRLHREGIWRIDFGLGNQAYKSEWAEPFDLYNNFLSCSRSGAVLSEYLIRKQAVRRFLKRSRRLQPPIKRMQSFLLMRGAKAR